MSAASRAAVLHVDGTLSLLTLTGTQDERLAQLEAAAGGPLKPLNNNERATYLARDDEKLLKTRDECRPNPFIALQLIGDNPRILEGPVAVAGPDLTQDVPEQLVRTWQHYADYFTTSAIDHWRSFQDDWLAGLGNWEFREDPTATPEPPGIG